MMVSEFSVQSRIMYDSGYGDSSLVSLGKYFRVCDVSNHHDTGFELNSKIQTNNQRHLEGNVYVSIFSRCLVANELIYRVMK